MNIDEPNDKREVEDWLKMIKLNIHIIPNNLNINEVNLPKIIYFIN